MATVDARSFRNATLEFNNNVGTPNWVAINNTFVEVAISGGDLPTEDTHVASSPDPIVTYGKRASKTVTITLVHSEVAGEGPALITAEWDDETLVQFRWTVKPATNPNKRWTTRPGLITNMTDPVGSVGAATSVKRTVTIVTPAVDEAVIAA
jgi:hypothetical protein